VPPLAAHVEATEAALAASLGGARPELMSAPGRDTAGIADFN
jgi:hypothetical protein